MQKFHYNGESYEFDYYNAIETLNKSIDVYQNLDSVNIKGVMISMVRSEIERHKRGITIGFGLENDMVYAGLRFLNKFDPEFKYRSLEEIKELYEQGSTLEYIYFPEVPPYVSQITKIGNTYCLGDLTTDATTVRCKVFS